MTIKTCVNCPGATDHDTAHCPLRVINYGALDPVQRLELARAGKHPEQAEGAQGHGHVTPRADGVKARCGGPAMCKVCQAEQARYRAEGAQGERVRFEAHFGPFSWDESDFAAEQAGWMARAALAQPSPAPELCQHCFGHGLNDPAGSEPCPLCKAPELERQEVAAFLLWPLKGSMAGQRFTGLGDIPTDANRELYGYERLMTVSQHDRIVGALRADDEALHRAVCALERKYDAAQARVAELEKQKPVAWGNFDNMELCLHKPSEGNWTPVYAAPVAQAGQAKKWTYASEQETNCAGCGKRKHTPLRVDWMGGYVCLTCIDEKLEELYEALPDAKAGQVPDGWKSGHPTQPGAYYVRGFRIFEGDSPAALVEIALDGDELVCNLHESNSEDNLGRWSLLSDFNESFEWFGPLAAAPAQGCDNQAADAAGKACDA